MNTTNDLLERNKEVVRHFLCVFSTGNVAGILECLDDDCIWWVSGNVPGISGSYDKQQMGELLRKRCINPALFSDQVESHHTVSY